MDRKKSYFEPWIVLICYFLFLVALMSLQMQVEEFFDIHLSPMWTDFLLSSYNVLLILFFFLYYKNKITELTSFFNFQCIKFFCGILFNLFVLFAGFIFPYLLLRENPDFHLTKSKSILAFLFPLIIAPILEEAFFRGILLKLFLEKYNVVTAIICNGVAFALIHLAPLPGQSVASLLLEFFVRILHGIFLSAITYKTKNLSFAFGFHISNNFLALLTS